MRVIVPFCTTVRRVLSIISRRLIRKKSLISRVNLQKVERSIITDAEKSTPTNLLLDSPPTLFLEDSQIQKHPQSRRIVL